MRLKFEWIMMGDSFTFQIGGPTPLAVSAIDDKQGTLTVVGHDSTEGETPRYFTIDPSGKYLFATNEGSDIILVFRIDPNSGRLIAKIQETRIPSPVCLTFLKVIALLVWSQEDGRYISFRTAKLLPFQHNGVLNDKSHTSSRYLLLPKRRVCQFDFTARSDGWTSRIDFVHTYGRLGASP